MALFQTVLGVLLHGLAYAMVLYLISVGLSVTMGLLGIANLAHGIFAMAGGYLTMTLLSAQGWSLPLALAVSFVHGGEKTIQWSACVCAGAGGVKVGHWIG